MTKAKTPVTKGKQAAKDRSPLWSVQKTMALRKPIKLPSGSDCSCSGK